MATVTEAQRSFYDEVGGAETFQLLVSRFYQLVRDDEILRPLYPEDDLDGAEHRLRMFLEQFLSPQFVEPGLDLLGREVAPVRVLETQVRQYAV
mgnify:CR=1 FL=1